jgi:uncharacterized membrane protein YsdA (DUF1294 family)
MIPVFVALSVFVCYVVINFIVFFLYAYDKYTVRTDGWRLPERLLISAALFGPFGAYAAMHLFHHKTRKMKFYLVPVFMVIHIAGILYVASSFIYSII